jgi:hypothetical protein
MPNALQRRHHHRRPGTVAAVGDLQRDRPTVGQRRSEHTVGAVLRHQAGHVPHEHRDVAAVAAHHLGVAVIAAYTSSPATPACPVAIARNARASPTSDIAWAGAPQPSTPMCACGSSHSSSIAAVIASWSGWSTCEVRRIVCPAVVHARGQHAAVLAAAVHQQRRARQAGAQHGLGRLPGRAGATRVGQRALVEAGTVPRMRSAASVCIGVPSWLAQTRASRSGGS